MNLRFKHSMAQYATVFLLFAAIISFFIRMRMLPPPQQALPSPTPFPLQTLMPTPQQTVYPIEQEFSFTHKHFYMLQCASLSSLESAQQSADMLQDKGLSAYIYEDSGSYKLFVNAYATHAQAEEAAEKLQETGCETYIKTLTAPEVTLGLQGPSDIILPLLDALSLLESFPEKLLACRTSPAALSGLNNALLQTLAGLNTVSPAEMPSLGQKLYTVLEAFSSSLQIAAKEAEISGETLARLLCSYCILCTEMNP